MKKMETTKDGKGTKATGTPAWGTAYVELTAEGIWFGKLTCLNGDPNRSTEIRLPGDIIYYGGKEKPVSPASLTVFLPDGVNVDTKYIFPWDPQSTDPLRLGGGHIKGGISEGAQRAAYSMAPVQIAFVRPDWVNGARAEIGAQILDTKGEKLYEGEQVFGMVMPNEKGQWVVVNWARSEGSCLDTVTA